VVGILIRFEVEQNMIAKVNLKQRRRLDRNNQALEVTSASCKWSFQGYSSVYPEALAACAIRNDKVETAVLRYKTIVPI
jgi:hypothetical protein